MDASKVMETMERYADKAGISSTPSSISSYASKAIYYFPILCSKSVIEKNAFTISSNLEASYASFVQACFSMIPAVVVKGDNINVEDYLKKFHQNIGISDGNEYYVSLKESAKPYLLFPNGTLNEAVNIKDIIGRKDIYDAVKEAKGKLDGITIGVEKDPEKKLFIPKRTFNVSETEKRNNLKPSIVKVSATFIISGTEVKVDIPVGVKTVIHPVNTNELCNHIMDSITVKGVLHNLIRYTTGEVLSLADILFGISKMKSNLKATGEMSKWIDAIEHRKRLNKISKSFLSKKPYLPNVSIILSMDDINDMERATGYNLLRDSNRATKFMKENFLLSLAIADDSTETAYILYDGHSSFEEYPYSVLKRENERNADAITALVRSTIR